MPLCKVGFNMLRDFLKCELTQHQERVSKHWGALDTSLDIITHG